MTELLNIHLANEAELRAAHANVHDVWHMGLPLEAHVERRLTAAHHRRATWIVGTLTGQVVCCLGLHPLEFQVRGDKVPGVGVASVHTLADFRGRGFAPRLIAWAEEHARSQGSELSMLFSDVNPAYYERMGYLLAPAHHGETAVAEQLHAAEQLLDNAGAQCESFDAPANLETLQQIYNDDHGREPVSIARSAEYWRYLFARKPDDEFRWLVHDRRPYAYVRFKVDGDTLFVRDIAVTSNAGVKHSSDLSPRELLFAGLIRRAHEMGLARVVGWLPYGAAERQWFQITPRPIEITMLKPLVAGLKLNDEQLAAADHFNEIDHV